MLQFYLTLIETWCKNWKVIINKSKSCHTNFTLKQGICPQITFNIRILTSVTTKYLGVNFDKRLTWNHRIHTTKIKLNSRLHSLNYFLNTKSKLSISTKLMLYKSCYGPYGVQIWGSAKKSNNSINATTNHFTNILTLLRKIFPS